MKMQTVVLFNSATTNSTKSSEIVPLKDIFKVSAQLVSTNPGANINGTLQLQVSNDISQSGALDPSWVPTTWSNLGAALTVNSASTQLIGATDVAFQWLKAVYTDASAGASTGRVTVKLAIQGV